MKFKVICCIVTPSVWEVKKGLVATLHITSSETIIALQQPHLSRFTWKNNSKYIEIAHEGGK